MKFVMMMSLFMCASALAEVPTLRASRVTCEELKETVEKYGVVNVKSKRLGIFTTTKYVQHKANCSADQYTRTFTFKTKDLRFCEVGEWCENPYTYYGGGYSGGGYSDSGSTTYDWPSHDGGSSGGSSDRGSSYNPPSRDYEGPRYDPPSRDSDRGPRYDPPSSGSDRGPRYCPSC